MREHSILEINKQIITSHTGLEAVEFSLENILIQVTTLNG